MKKIFFFALVVSVALALTGCAARECETCIRVLFVGNSYTSFNSLPTMFAKLAAAGGHDVETGIFAKNGWSLAEHAQAPQLSNTLQSSRWNYVILQEQSTIPATEQTRIALMHPAARTLAEKVRSVNATPLFFQTWAHLDGLPEAGLNYEAMQYEIDAGYYGIALELNIAIAPVGDAWFNAVTQSPGQPLWQDDGSHPTAQGTYLAACVFYAVIFNESPEGLSFTGGLPAETASYLQMIAAQSTLP